MSPYSAQIRKEMKLFYESLAEKDRRRYAAVEADKLDHGGVEYIAAVLGCDPKTIWQGQQDVAELPADKAAGRIRKKGGSQTS